MENEEGFKINAKGYLTALGYMLKDGEIQPLDLWPKMLEFVSREAKENCGEGLPCLVMVDGGNCITAEKKKADGS